MARIDLNAAPKELLSGLFAGLGASRASADAYADRIIGWRTAPGSGTPDESSYYRAAGLLYSPRTAPFQHVAELGLVLGIPEVLVERATPFLTVYSGQAGINPMDAAPQVMSVRVRTALPARKARWKRRLKTSLLVRAWSASAYAALTWERIWPSPIIWESRPAATS